MPKAILLSRFPPAEYLPEGVLEGYDLNGELAGGYSMVGHVPNGSGLCVVWVDVNQAVATQIKNDNNFVVLGIIGQDNDVSAKNISQANQTKIKSYFINKGFDKDMVNSKDISDGWKLIKEAGKLLGVSPDEIRELIERQVAE